MMSQQRAKALPPRPGGRSLAVSSSSASSPGTRMCEECRKVPASQYCKQCVAKLCPACDMQLHSSRVTSTHVRCRYVNGCILSPAPSDSASDSQPAHPPPALVTGDEVEEIKKAVAARLPREDYEAEKAREVLTKLADSIRAAVTQRQKALEEALNKWQQQRRSFNTELHTSVKFNGAIRVEDAEALKVLPVLGLVFQDGDLNALNIALNAWGKFEQVTLEMTPEAPTFLARQPLRTQTLPSPSSSSSSASQPTVTALPQPPPKPQAQPQEQLVVIQQQPPQAQPQPRKPQVPRRPQRDYAGTIKLPKRTIGYYGDEPEQFKLPIKGVAVHPVTGEVILTDPWQQKLKVFTPDGAFVKFLGGDAADWDLKSVDNVAVDPTGTYVVCDRFSMTDCAHNLSVWKYDDGSFVCSFGRGGSSPGCFARVGGVAIDNSSHVIATDCERNRMMVFTMEGKFIREMGFATGSGEGEFNTPLGLAADPVTGNIIVADSYNNRMQVWAIDGTFVRDFGRQGQGPGQFWNPRAVTVDSWGNIIVLDMDNQRVQVFKPDWTFVCQFGKVGTGRGEFKNPRGITVDASGVIYVADSENFRVQVW